MEKKTRKSTPKTATNAGAKIAPKTEIKQPQVSIGIPTRDNLKILWLALEGMLRQVTDVAYEIIVLESPSANLAKEVVDDYRDLFAEKGVKLSYKLAPLAPPLAIKWKELARMAQAEYFIMLGSDDYPPSTLVQRTFEAFEEGAHWVDSPSAYFYDFATGEIGLWKKPYPRSGCQCACRTADLRGIADTDIPRGVDQFIMDSVAPVIHTEIHHVDGVHTDGYNQVTKHRAALYNTGNCRRPFHSTDVTLNDLVPTDVWVRMNKIRK